MNNKTDGDVHWSFWAVGVVALIWHLMGGMNFIGQLSPEMIASMPETHRAIIEGRPLWATAGFAISVFGGAIGCLLLLLRKSTAFHLFIASLLGTIVAIGHTLSLYIDLSPFEFVMMIVMSPVVAAVLVGYSKSCENKGWLR